MPSQPPAQHDAGVESAEWAYRARLQRALGSDYALAELIGRGGMGAVYGARDLRLDRDVAVKALLDDVCASPIAIERFQREAKALARLRHPNVLPVYAVGEAEGLAYMITPRIVGSTLRELLDREGALACRDATRIALDIARGLDAAHRMGIVHRDVKPDNILLEGPEHHALLADFGIAKSAHEEPALTTSGIMLGSPRYMSPEQVNGDSDFDHRADIYALGAVLYEMLAGRPAFDGETVQRVIVQKITSDAPPLVLAPDAAPSVAVVVARCMARDPSGRFQAASEVASALAAAGGSAAVVSRDRPSWFAVVRDLLIA